MIVSVVCISTDNTDMIVIPPNHVLGLKLVHIILKEVRDTIMSIYRTKTLVAREQVERRAVEYRSSECEPLVFCNYMSRVGRKKFLF